MISIGYGQRDMTIDAGIVVTSGSVGDYVWLDTNRNGIQDEEDTGLEGIRVVLEYSPPVTFPTIPSGSRQARPRPMKKATTGLTSCPRAITG